MTKRALILFIPLFSSFILRSQNMDTSNAIMDAIQQINQNSMEIQAKPEANQQGFLVITQTTDANQKKDETFKRANLDKWSVGIGYGITQFYGDIKQYDWYPSTTAGFFELKTGLGLQVNRVINSIFSVQGEFFSGKMGGLRRKTQGVQFPSFDPYGFYEGNGEKFVADFLEFDLNTTVNLNHLAVTYLKNYKDNRFTYFLKFGLGQNYFHTVKRNLFSDKYIYSYGYEDEAEYGGNIKKGLLATTTETVFISGFTMRYNLSERMDLYSDITMRTGKTDKWDASIEELGSTFKNDRIAFISFGLVYHLGKKRIIADRYNPIDKMYKTYLDVDGKIKKIGLDSDKDGVSDYFDKNERTPLGVAVDGSGVPLDVDMDNIPDYLDADPFSARGAVVDANGVELDTDGDGIPNSKDLETNTPSGSFVNQFGMAITNSNGKDGENGISSVYFPSVYFESASTKVEPSNYIRMAVVAKVMLTNPQLSIKVIGNTYNDGSSEFNEKLGKERAEAVVRKFVEIFGISSDRFEISSQGEHQPLSLSKDAVVKIEGNKQIQEDYKSINRRVDFEIVR